MFVVRFIRSVISFFHTLPSSGRESRLYASFALAAREQEQTNPVVGAETRLAQAPARRSSAKMEAEVMSNLASKHPVVINLLVRAASLSGQNSFDFEATRLRIESSDANEIGQLLDNLTPIQREVLWLLIGLAHQYGWRTDFMRCRRDEFALQHWDDPVYDPDKRY